MRCGIYTAIQTSSSYVQHQPFLFAGFFELSRTCFDGPDTGSEVPPRSVLGLGGMGKVYYASRVLIGDKVAVKVLHPERVGDRRQ